MPSKNPFQKVSGIGLPNLRPQRAFGQPADLAIGDTAGLATCATGVPRDHTVTTMKYPAAAYCYVTTCHSPDSMPP
jgi:hypothetical protein